MLLKIFHIRKLIRQGMADPGRLAAEETRGALSAFTMIPGVIILVWLTVNFLLGFTSILGGPFGFFKFLFIVSIIGTGVLVWFVYKFIVFAGKIAKKTANKITNADFKIEK